MGFHLHWGTVACLKPLRGVTASRLLDRGQTFEKLKELAPLETVTDTAVGDYPRAIPTTDGIERIRAWIANWRHQHRKFAIHATGRECEAFSKKMAEDLRFHAEVNDMAAVLLVAWVRGFAVIEGKPVLHANLAICGPGGWELIDPFTGKPTITTTLRPYLV